jgi:hypothetical protein
MRWRFPAELRHVGEPRAELEGHGEHELAKGTSCGRTWSTKLVVQGGVDAALGQMLRQCVAAMLVSSVQLC